MTLCATTQVVQKLWTYFSSDGGGRGKTYRLSSLRSLEVDGPSVDPNLITDMVASAPQLEVLELA